MRSTQIRWVIAMVAVAVAAAIVGLIERLPFEEVHPLKLVVIEAAFLAAPVAGAWLLTTRWRQLGIVALVATAALNVVSLAAALMVLGQGIIPDWLFVVHAALLVAAGIFAWRLRDPLSWRWTRQPTVLVPCPTPFQITGEVAPTAGSRAPRSIEFDSPGRRDAPRVGALADVLPDSWTGSASAGYLSAFSVVVGARRRAYAFPAQSES